MYKRVLKFFNTKVMLIIFTLLFLITGSNLSVSADTAGPAVSNLKPAPGTTTESKTPQFSLTFNDPDRLDSGVILQVDGQALSPVITWDGIFETYYDECSGDAYNVRVGDDYTKGTITAQMPTLSIGQHTVYYKLKDQAGNFSEQSYNFTISDITGPAITELIPAGTSTVATGYPVIKAKITDPNGVDPSSIGLTINGGGVVVNYDNITETITYKSPTLFRNGTYQVTLNAKDLQGNPSTALWTFTVNDLSGPTVTELSPANDSFTKATSPVLQARISDPSGVVNPVKIKVDGIGYDASYNDQSGKVSFTMPLTLDVGRHTVALTVYDQQNNGTTVNWGFGIDTSGPVLSNIYPSDGATLETTRPKVSINFSDLAQLDPAISLQVDGNSLTPQIAWDGIFETYYDECSGDAYTVRVGDDYTKGVVTAQCPELSAGTHTISYQFKDRLGNITANSYTITVSDTTGPKLVSCTPSKGAVIGSGTPQLTAKLEDANRIVSRSVYLYLNGEQLNATFDAGNSVVTYNQTEPLLNGNYEVKVTAEDELGNSSTNLWNFTISDVAPPTFEGLTPAPNSVTLSTTPTIEAKISDPSGITNPVYLQVDQSVYTVNRNFATGKATYIPGQQLSSGTHTVTMVAYDFQGQRGVSTWSFYVDKSGPELTVVNPSPGSTVPMFNPNISMRFYDVSGVNNTNVRMLLDGALVQPTFAYDGLYQTFYDECSGEEYTQRVGDDYTKGSISYQTPQLENLKEHSVQLFVYDKVGNVTPLTWSFIVHDNVSPGFSNFAPAPDSTIANSSVVISAKVYDNNLLDPQKVQMTLNGEVVGSFNSTTGIVAYTPVQPLLDNAYTVAVSAYDMFGNYHQDSWQFILKHQGAPGITNLLPPNGSGTRTAKPTISAKVFDERGIDVSKLNLTVDSTLIPVRFLPDSANSVVSGTVYGVPVNPLSSAMHTAVLTVFDLSGNIKREIWEFGVNQFGDMGVTAGDCRTCHNQSNAEIEQRHVAGAGNCELCHTYTAVGWEPDCCYCHGHDQYFPPPVTYYSCETCHNSSLSTVIPTHGSAAELNVHNNTQLPENCKTCHSAYLTREHNVYVEGRGVAYDCNTCHKSSNSTVTGAINNHKKNCSDCHGAESNHESVHVSGISQSCIGCHTTSLTTEHIVSAGLQCDTCHQSAVPAVANALKNKNKQCTACHSTGHNQQLTVGLPSDIPLYAGLKWSHPIDARVFAGEEWALNDFIDGGYLLISNRSNLPVQVVWEFYQREMLAKGWTLQAVNPEVPSQHFNATFTKGGRLATIWLNRDNSTETPSGTRLEIVYMPEQ